MHHSSENIALRHGNVSGRGLSSQSRFLPPAAKLGVPGKNRFDGMDVRSVKLWETKPLRGVVPVRAQ